MLAWWALFVVVLAGLFLAFTRWQGRTRAHHEPYPVETYDGYISEGNGPVGGFLWVFFAVVVGWLVYVTFQSLAHGQIY